MPIVTQNRRPVAFVEVQFNCGCGYKTTKPLEAKDHAVATGHTVTICGQVGSFERSENESKISDAR